MVSKPKKFGIILSEKVLQLASFTTRFFKNLKLAFQSQLLPQIQGLGKNYLFPNLTYYIAVFADRRL